MRKILGGEVHALRKDLKKALLDSPKALEIWHDITPLARTEWIAWIEDAKKLETRNKRIEVGIQNYPKAIAALAVGQATKM